jgi:hypothetical protein
MGPTGPAGTVTDIWVNTTGDEMTGNLRMNSAIIAPVPLQELSIGSIDDASATKLIVGGSSRVRIENTKVSSNVPITVLADPVQPMELATKQYVDARSFDYPATYDEQKALAATP